MPKGTVITLFNRHLAVCGEPPAKDNTNASEYIGYFANSYGEQWVFVFDRQRGRGYLRGGDLGWDQSFRVVGGRATGVLLGSEEAAWLKACWIAATGGCDAP